MPLPPARASSVFDLPPPPPPPRPPAADFSSLDESDLAAALPDFSATPPPPVASAGFDFGGIELEKSMVAAPAPAVAAADRLALDDAPASPAGPSPAAPAPAVAPSLGAPASPMGGSVDEGDLELLDFIDAAAPASTAAPLPEGRFHVRRKTGKVFGPFEAPLVIKMLSEGQLFGNEDVSVDMQTWQPIGSVPGFAEAIQRLMEAPGALARGKSESGSAFGGRMADVSFTNPGEVAGGRRSLLAPLREHARAVAAAGAALVFLVAGGAMELLTPWGFWFRRPIVALVLGGSGGGAQVAKLLSESSDGLRANTYGSMRDALEKARQAHKLDPEGVATRAQLALVTLLLEHRFGGFAKDVSQVRPLVQALAGEEPDDPAVIKAVAARDLLDGKLPQARASLQALVQQDPADQQATFMLVRAQLSSDTPEDARVAAQHIQRLLQIDPRSARALHARGRVLEMGGDEAAAASSFAAALEADPRHTASAVEAARIALESRKDVAESERLIALALSPQGAAGLGPAEMASALAYQAETLHRRGQPAQAEPIFQQALARDPTSTAARAYYGHFLLEQNQVEKAIELLAPVREEKPGNVAVAMDLALAHSRRGKMLESMKILEELQAKLPRDARVAYLRGLVFLENGKRDDGVQALSAAAEQDATYAAPLVKLARTFLDEGKLEDARRRLEEAASRAPDHPDVQAAQGFYHLAAGEPEVALGYFDKALQVQPGYASAHHGRALVLERKGDVAGARAAYEAALVTGASRPRIRMDFGSLLFDAGELDAAINELEAAKKLEPKNARIRTRLGAVKYHAGKIEEAIVHVQNALALDSKDPETFLYLSLLSKAKGDLPRAVEAGRTAVNLDPKNPRLSYELGLVYEASNNPVEALEWFRRAATLDPRHADAMEHAAAMQTTLNATHDAIKSYEAALAADPSRTRLLQAVGEAYIRAREWKRAIAKLKEALATDPSLVGVYFQLGLAYQETGKSADAIKSFELAVQKEPENAQAYKFLGFAYKEKGRNRDAAAAFRKYLARSPGSDDKAEIEDEIATLAP